MQIIKVRNVHKEKRKWANLTEAATEAAATSIEEAATSAVQEKCTKLPVQDAAQNVKYHSSQPKVDQFTAKIVTQRTNHQETKSILRLGQLSLIAN